MKDSEIVPNPNQSMYQLRASQRKSYRVEEPVNQVRQSQKKLTYAEEIFAKYDTSNIGRVHRN